MQEARSVEAQQAILGTEGGLLRVWALQRQPNEPMATECP